MLDILRATLGNGDGRALLVEPSGQLAPELAALGGTVMQVRPSHRGAKRLGGTGSTGGAAVCSLCADPAALPFAPGSFDAAACCSGAPDEEQLVALRSLVRVGGVLLVASHVREGVAGGAASLVRRAARSGALPRASDLTALMLRAGLRPVRQAAAKRAVVPTVVTWAEVRARPWERSSEGSEEGPAE